MIKLEFIERFEARDILTWMINLSGINKENILLELFGKHMILSIKFRTVAATIFARKICAFLLWMPL